MALQLDLAAQAQRFVIRAIGGEHSLYDFRGAVQIAWVHGLAHLLNEGAGQQVSIVEVARVVVGQGFVHFDALVGGHAGNFVGHGAVGERLHQAVGFVHLGRRDGTEK